jgi:chromosome segregation ATPase
MPDDALDELYWVKPADFTAVRARLAKAAKERGDATAAREISGSRKPTTAAWVVNRLAISHNQTKRRLTDLRERLRAAHAALNGARIRELTQEQRGLVDQLSAAAFDSAELNDPSPALRDDVMGTLQAAVADPDVTQRLGRLAKAEQWAGFGDFAVVQPDSDEDVTDAQNGQLQTAREFLAQAEEAVSEAESQLSKREDDVLQARRRLEEAQRELARAEKEHAKAKQRRDDSAQEVSKAHAALKRLGG